MEGRYLMEAVEAIVKRAASDPEFLKRFVEDPVGTTKAEGIELPAASGEEIVAALLAAGAAGQQVAELLQQRISQMGLPGGLDSFFSGSFPTKDPDKLIW